MQESADLIELMKGLSSYKDIQLIDIPDIDLYMDQVTTFMENKMEALKRAKKDKILTKTMINNYTKDGILMFSHNKKYSRQHIIILILVYNLKRVLSIKDISCLLNPLIKVAGTDGDSHLWEKIYQAYLDLKQLELDSLSDLSSDKLELISKKVGDCGQYQQEVELLLLVLLLVNQANIRTRMAEKIIDEYFNNRDYQR